MPKKIHDAGTHTHTHTHTQDIIDFFFFVPLSHKKQFG